MTTTMSASQSQDNVMQLTYDMTEIVREGFGVTEAEAARMAATIVNGMRHRYGGVRLGRRGLYIPVPCKDERNAAICREFDGTNAQEVMRRHGIKRSTLYTIVGQRNRSRNGSNRNGIGSTGPAAP